MPGVKKRVFPKYKPKKKKTAQLSLLEAIDDKVEYKDLTDEDKAIVDMPFEEWVEKGPSVFEWSESLLKYSGLKFKK